MPAYGSVSLAAGRLLALFGNVKGRKNPVGFMAFADVHHNFQTTLPVFQRECGRPVRSDRYFQQQTVLAVVNPHLPLFGMSASGQLPLHLDPITFDPGKNG